MPKAARRLVAIDLSDVLEEEEKKERASTTSIRLPQATLAKLDAIADANGMSRTKLLRNLVEALIKDWEARPPAKRK